MGRRARRDAQQVRVHVHAMGVCNTFKRYLVFSTEGPSPIVGAILRSTETCAEAIEIIRSFRESDRVPTLVPLLYAFSRIAHRRGNSAHDIETRRKALEMLPDICKTPTQLFMFLRFGDSWGSMKKAAVRAWYTKQPPMKLAHLVTKYRSREGWTHLDVMRMAHIRVSDLTEDMQSVMQYIHSGVARHPYLQVVETVRHATSEEAVTSAIAGDRATASPNIVMEHIPKQFLSSLSVWGLIVDTLGLTCLMRSLSKLTSIGMFNSPLYTDIVTAKLTDSSILAAARMHPMNVLIAWKTYRSSKSVRGHSTWQPDALITSALETAFYASFKYVEPTNLRIFYALDVSGSMAMETTKAGLSCFEAMIAMVMTLVRTEPTCTCMAFANGLYPFPISARSTLEEAMTIAGPQGSTDCALPMMHAVAHGLEFDCIAIFTDNDHNTRGHDPYMELQKYRRQCGIDIRAVVCGMSSSRFSVFPDADPLCLNLAGFDANAPAQLKEFFTQ